jgi:hypothetical protein
MPTINIDVVSNLGILEMGSMVSFFLFGITTMQAYIRRRQYKSAFYRYSKSLSQMDQSPFINIKDELYPGCI